MKETQTIDIEPTWEALCNMAFHGHIKADLLMPACKIADTVRQAQKRGDKSVTFKFTGKNGNMAVIVDDEKPEK
jgi:hypothetical protein